MIKPSQMNCWDRLSEMGIPTMLICLDNMQIPFVHKRIAQKFNLVWLTSKETEHLFKKWGANTLFMPYAANPYNFKPKWGEELECVGFVGTLYGTRIREIVELAADNLPLELYSRSVQENEVVLKGNLSGREIFRNLTKWMDLLSFDIGRKCIKAKIKNRFLPDSRHKLFEKPQIGLNGSVSFEEMNKLYSNFALNLGLTTLWETYILTQPLYKIHLRSFEIPACGGLQITPRIPEFEEYFEDGKEVIFYDGIKDFSDKVKYYLSPDKGTLRKAMRQAARRRQESDHTWIRRFEKVHEECFGI